MKKTKLLLAIILLSLTSFAQDDPLSQAFLSKLLNITIPAYSSGGSQMLVKNSTTGNLELQNISGGGGSFDSTHSYTWLAPQTFTLTGLAATTTPVLTFQNTTAATSGIQFQHFPALYFYGQTWNSSASIKNGFRIKDTTTRQSTNVRTAMCFDFTKDGGATWSSIVTFNPFTSIPATVFNLGGVSITSGNFTTGAGNIMCNGSLIVNGANVMQNGETVFASLPTPNSSFGQQTTITDCLTNNIGDICAGGGSYLVLVWCNGTNWTVIGH